MNRTYVYSRLQFNSIDCDSASNKNVPNMSAKGQSSNIDIGNYENSSFSKWSDYSFETPFVPVQRDVSVDPQTKRNEKIRKNLFGNSYFNDGLSSAQMMTKTKSGSAMAQNELDVAEYTFGQMQNSKFLLSYFFFFYFLN